MNFADALNVKVGDFERPPLPPVGHYVWRVEKVEFGDVADGRFDTVDFRLSAVSPGEDVDQEALAEAGGIKGIRLRYRFMFNTGDDPESKANAERTFFNLRQFLTKHLQIDGAEDMSLKEAIDASIGAQCLANLQLRPDRENPEIMYPEIGRTAPVA